MNLTRRIGEYMRQVARDLHIVHTWSPWTQSGPTFPVAYPWTKAGCFAHYVTNFTRHCTVCDLPERRQEIS